MGGESGCPSRCPCREAGGQDRGGLALTAQTDAAVAPRHSSHLSPTFYADGPERVRDSPRVTQHPVPEARLPGQGALCDITLFSDQHPSGLKTHLFLGCSRCN